MHPIREKENGWGGRIRTYECRDQNPVPYHLATPQRETGLYRQSIPPFKTWETLPE